MKWSQAVAIDVVAVLFFALVGRQAHSESSDLLGVAWTAWPFLAGVALGTAASLPWRSPVSKRTGVLVWLSTVVAGMLLRLVSGSTDQLSFIVVATVVLGLLLFGWRVVARAIGAGEATDGASEPDV